MRKKIVSVPAMAESSVVRLFGDVDRVTDSSPDTKVMFVIKTVVSRAIDSRFQSAAFYSLVEESVNKCVS